MTAEPNGSAVDFYPGSAGDSMQRWKNCRTPSSTHSAQRYCFGAF